MFRLDDELGRLRKVDFAELMLKSDDLAYIRQFRKTLTSIVKMAIKIKASCLLIEFCDQGIIVLKRACCMYLRYTLRTTTDTAHKSSGGRCRHRSAVERGRLGSPLGILRADGRKSGVNSNDKTC